MAEVVPERPGPLSRRATGVLVLGILAALAGLSVGAQVMVSGATGVAGTLGTSERVVGLTLAAVGTSVPELAFSVAAAFRNQQEMAVANVVGSNLFNLLMILQATGLARPIAVGPPLVFRGQKLTHPGGLVLVLAYLAYLGWLLVAAA